MNVYIMLCVISCFIGNTVCLDAAQSAYISNKNSIIYIPSPNDGAPMIFYNPLFLDDQTGNDITEENRAILDSI